jgi:hypothetical protein
VSAVWLVLLQFVFRLTMGIALAMAATSPRVVTAGFYRVHLWVLMGLNTFALLAVFAHRQAWPHASLLLGLAGACAVLSYLGSVLWLYEKKRAGRAALVILGLLGLAAATVAGYRPTASVDASLALFSHVLQVCTSGWLPGATVTAMLLGHWYLNTPGMELAPLRRLLLLMGGGTAARAIVCGGGLAWAVAAAGAPSPTWWSLVGLRWLSGIVGVLVLCVLAWRTLLIPNTQSATGILYAAVIIVFMGELSSQFLSIGTPYPL